MRRKLSALGHGGENELRQRASTDMHKKAALAKGASNISAFFATSTAEKDKITASEVSYVYHMVKHGLSYKQLNGVLCNDSNVIKKMRLG